MKTPGRRRLVVFLAVMAFEVTTVASAARAVCALTPQPSPLPAATPWLANADASVALFEAPMAQDDDGAPNAYHPCGANYPGGGCGTRFGLDHICSGVTVIDPSGKIVPRSINHSSKACLAGFLAAEAAAFPPCKPSHAGKFCVSEWPAMVLRHGQPLTWESGPYKGYYVSTTSLQRPDASVPGGRASVDARRAPYVVVPGRSALTKAPWSFASNGRPDLAVVVYRSPKGEVRAAYAVVGDIGSAGRIGEGSSALLQALKNAGPTPPAYVDRPPTSPIAAKVTYLLLRGSSGSLSATWPAQDLDAPTIASAGKKALERTGGLKVFAGCGAIPADPSTVRFVPQ